MALYVPSYQPNGNEIAIIKTSKGDIRVELHGNDAPIHVGNFVELAQKGFYDNLKFHRYVPGFVIQGGCPNTRPLDSEQVKAAEGNPFAGLGTGGPWLHHRKKSSLLILTTNTLMAQSLWLVLKTQILLVRSFTFALGAQPFLDDGYTVFGQTVEGLDVVGNLRVGDVIETIIIEGANE